MKTCNLKLFFYSIFFSFFFINCLSQEEFSFALNFEDAIGNKDSLVLGHDENATDSIDNLFNEFNIAGTSWDNSLEVRSGRFGVDNYFWYYFSNTPNFQSKKQIVSKSCTNDDFSICVNLKTENFPVVIRWDSTLFNYDNCLKGSKLNIEPIFQTDDYTEFCRFLSSEPSSFATFGIDSIVITEPDKNLLEYYTDNNDTIYLFWVSLSEIQDYSMKMSELSTTSVIKTFNLYNDNSIILFDFMEGEATLIDFNGKVIRSLNIENGKCEIGNLKKGLYFLVSKNREVREYKRNKLIKH